MPNSYQIDKSKLNNLLNSKDLLISKFISSTVDGDQHLHIGKAEPGTADEEPGWFIQRTVVYANGNVFKLIAGGTINFNQIWDDRAVLSYS